MAKYFLFVLATMMSNTLPQPKVLVWEILALTTYNNEFKENGEMRFKPNFPSPLLDLENEWVSISGYLVPMDVAAKQYALSRNAFKSCFFCGNAGPETVIELRFKEDPGRFKVDEYLNIKGKLKLNRNGEDLFFTLLQAEVL
jgi:hypothetical protein